MVNIDLAINACKHVLQGFMLIQLPKAASHVKKIVNYAQMPSLVLNVVELKLFISLNVENHVLKVIPFLIQSKECVKNVNLAVILASDL